MAYVPFSKIGYNDKPQSGKLARSQDLHGIIDQVNSASGVMPSTGGDHPHLGKLILLCQITNPATGGGIYAARRVRVNDAGTFDPGDPAAPADLLEDDGEDSMILINTAEAGASTHLIDDGEYVGVIRTGVSIGLLEIGIIIGAPAGSTASPTVIGSSSEGSETAATDSWSRATNGTPVDVWMQSRTVYDHASGEILYGFARKLSHDSTGLLIAVSAETRYTIDSPEDC